MANKSAPQFAQDKLAFLLALVPYLIDRDRVSVSDAAAHFGVSQEQIRGAVRLIGVSGIPGATSMYQHGDLFDIAWDDFEDNDEIVITNMVAIDETPRFSSREAAALIAGLQYLSSVPEHADRDAVNSLMSKLARSSSSTPTHLGVEARATDATLRLIRDAVDSGVQVGFDYVSASGVTEHRTVDPLRIESVDMSWYLRGWCHLREAVRTFRIDRISNAFATSEPIAHARSEVPLPEGLFEGSLDDVTVTIDIAPGAIAMIADYGPDGDVESGDDGRIITTLKVPHYHGLKRLISSMPGLATVMSPAAARVAISEWASAGVARYDNE